MWLGWWRRHLQGPSRDFRSAAAGHWLAVWPTAGLPLPLELRVCGSCGRHRGGWGALCRRYWCRARLGLRDGRGLRPPALRGGSCRGGDLGPSYRRRGRCRGCCGCLWVWHGRKGGTATWCAHSSRCGRALGGGGRRRGRYQRGERDCRLGRDGSGGGHRRGHDLLRRGTLWHRSPRRGHLLDGGLPLEPFLLHQIREGLRGPRGRRCPRCALLREGS